jgi:hypothetical protein
MEIVNNNNINKNLNHLEESRIKDHTKKINKCKSHNNVRNRINNNMKKVINDSIIPVNINKTHKVNKIIKIWMITFADYFKS